MTTALALPGREPARDIKLEVVEENYDFDEALWPQQTIAFDSPATEILFGGAKGPGKSFLLRFSFIMWCIECAGLQCYLFRRMWNDLKQNHLEGPKSFHVMLAKMIERRHAQIVTHEVRFWNGSRIFLNHLQLKKHVTKYQGPEIHALGMDELTQFEPEQYTYLLGSMRLAGWKPPKNYRHKFPCVLAGANPGGVSHSFVKERFIDQGAYKITKRKSFHRQFIPARNTDNPALLQNDPGYLDRLEEMGDLVLVRAMKEGDWEVAIGSMFGEIWRKTKNGRPWHVMPNARIPYGWDMWRGGDDGFVAPLAFLWFAQDPHRKTIYVIDELYGAGYQPSKASELTIERDLSIPMVDRGREITNPDILTGNLDNEAFSKEGVGEREITRGDQMNARGCRWKPVEKWPGSRVAGIKNIHRLLAPNKLSANEDYPDGKPGLIFFEKCVNAIKYIPTIPRSERDPEDVDTDYPHDHVVDSLRYGLQHKVGGFKKRGIAGL